MESLAVTEKTMPRQENFTNMDLADLLGQSRRQILAAQFECYLKIIHDPVTEEGDDNTLPIVPSQLDEFLLSILFLVDGGCCSIKEALKSFLLQI